MNFTLILSDAHLAPIFQSERLPYRGSAFAPDAELSRTIDEAVMRAKRHNVPLEVVLAGDVFDLDVPRDGEEARRCCALFDVRTDDGGAYVLKQTLNDHLGVVLALRRALAAGAKVTVIPGNHDAQLGLSGPQAVLQQMVGGDVLFRPWCHLAAGGLVLVEHGHQYDPLCTVNRLVPTARTETTVGTVSSFYAPLLLEADPFVTDPFSDRKKALATLRETVARFGATPLVRCARDLLAASLDRPAPDDTHELAAQAAMDPQLAGLRQALFASKATILEALDITGYAAKVDRAIDHAMTVATDVHGAKVAVVGHTHAPGSRQLSNGATLLNSGSWTPRRAADAPVGTFAWIVTNGRHVVSTDVLAVRRKAWS